MLKTFLVLNALMFSLSSFGVELPQAYLSGKELSATNAELLKNEKGFFIPSPIDHKNIKAGSFDLYAWFDGDFKPERTTLVYLAGGPGIGTHWGQRALLGNHNLLMVDQRGISCSKPRTEKDYLNPDFYSSENIALDLEVLRKHLKIKSWSVYGVSYGTIPATIYASKFPMQTKSLILEGVAYDAETLWKQARRRDLVIDALNAQSVVVQGRLKSIEQYEVDPSWFFRWARDEFMWNTGRSKLLTQMKRFEDHETFVSFTKMLIAQYGPQKPFPKNELFVMNETPYYMISCQELGVMNYPSDLTWSERFDVVPAMVKDVFKNCLSLKAHPKKLYTALDYPVTVPTFYFQGENDGATEVNGALNHFRKVAKGKKQFFLMSEGGHNPNIEVLKTPNPGQKKLFSNAVNGILSSEKVIQETNSSLKGLKWKNVP